MIHFRMQKPAINEAGLQQPLLAYRNRTGTDPFDFVRVQLAFLKNSRDARQYVQTELADELRKYIATKAPGARVFNMPDKHEVVPMFLADLDDARRAWPKAAPHDPGEYAHREQSDFLAEVTHEGEVLDFHSLRHTCGAWLALAGAHPKEVQAVMRHSTITLTMDTYGHLFPGAEARTVARFPGMLTDNPGVMRSTGSDAATAEPERSLG